MPNLADVDDSAHAASQYTVSNKDPEADKQYEPEPISGKKQTLHAVGQGMPLHAHFDATPSSTYD